MGDYLCYDLVTRNIDGVAAAHIHEVDRADGQERTNPRELTGGVVVDLQPNATETTTDPPGVAPGRVLGPGHLRA